MEDSSDTESGQVDVSMEITGAYEDVLSKLTFEERRDESIEPFCRDVEILLDTLEHMGEGTRSTIAERLPEEMTVEYDAEAVVDLLQVLKRYELVVLEGNTWKPNRGADGE
jgi:hypothetical protein